MAKAIGIGGVFFRAVDPVGLTAWYAKHLGIDSEAVSFASPTLPRLHLTIATKPIFRLFCLEAYQYAHRGSVFPYPMEVERLNGFEGEIMLQIGDRQNRDRKIPRRKSAYEQRQGKSGRKPEYGNKVTERSRATSQQQADACGSG